MIFCIAAQTPTLKIVSLSLAEYIKERQSYHKLRRSSILICYTRRISMSA